MSQSKPRPYLPKTLRTFVIKQLHDALSHDGIKETIRRISSHYYWLDIKAELTRYAQTCHGCQSVKPTKLRPPHFGKFEVPDDRLNNFCCIMSHYAEFHPPVQATKVQILLAHSFKKCRRIWEYKCIIRLYIGPRVTG